LVGWWNSRNRWTKQGFQAIGLWSQSKDGLTRSDESLKEEFIGQASKAKGKCLGSNG